MCLYPIFVATEPQSSAFISKKNFRGVLFFPDCDICEFEMKLEDPARQGGFYFASARWGRTASSSFVSLKAPHLDHHPVINKWTLCSCCGSVFFAHVHAQIQYFRKFKEDLHTSRSLNVKRWFFQNQRLQRCTEVGGANRRLLEERKPVRSQISGNLV